MPCQSNCGGDKQLEQEAYPARSGVYSSLREGVAVPEGGDGGVVYSDILMQHSCGFFSGFEI